MFKKNLSVDYDLSTLLDEILSYNVFKNSERKIWLSNIKVENNKLFSYERVHKRYTIIKRSLSNTLKDSETKGIINRRKRLLSEFNL